MSLCAVGAQTAAFGAVFDETLLNGFDTPDSSKYFDEAVSQIPRMSHSHRISTIYDLLVSWQYMRCEQVIMAIWSNTLACAMHPLHSIIFTMSASGPRISQHRRQMIAEDFSGAFIVWKCIRHACSATLSGCRNRRYPCYILESLLTWTQKLRHGRPVGTT